LAFIELGINLAGEATVEGFGFRRGCRCGFPSLDRDRFWRCWALVVFGVDRAGIAPLHLGGLGFFSTSLRWSRLGALLVAFI
jgi:hypothetical protein